MTGVQTCALPISEERLRAATALAGGDLPADFGQDNFNAFLNAEEDVPQDDVSQLVALLTEEEPAKSGEGLESNPFVADPSVAPPAEEGSL